MESELLSQMSQENVSMLKNMLGQLTGSDEPMSFDEKVKEYEAIHDAKLIFINHLRQRNSAMGIDLNFFGTHDKVTNKDAMAVLDTLREIPDTKRLDIVLHTTGGELAAAEVIVKALLNHKGEIHVHIPYYAMSAGTFIALAANFIHLGAGGWLTQVDPSVGGWWSAASILEYTNSDDTQRSWFTDITSLARIGANKAMQRAVELMDHICETRGYSDSQTRRLHELLVTGASNHDKSLTADLLADLPNLVHGVDDDILGLYDGHCKQAK